MLLHTASLIYLNLRREGAAASSGTVPNLSLSLSPAVLFSGTGEEGGFWIPSSVLFSSDPSCPFSIAPGPEKNGGLRSGGLAAESFSTGDELTPETLW